MVSEAAFLGPQGSYSHKAAQILTSSLGKEVELVPRSTIPNVYTSFSLTYAVIPLENTLHGVVTETLDCLLHPADSHTGQWTVINELDLKIEHCLVVRKGTKLEDVKWVMSHEQALGQCRFFLTTQLGSAKRIPVSSTALAASIVAAHDPSPSSSSEPNGAAASSSTAAHLVAGLNLEIPEGEGAAICSSSAIETLEGVEIYKEGIQDVKGNYTRFLLLSRSDNPTVPETSYTVSKGLLTLGHPSYLSRLPPSARLHAIHSRPYLPAPNGKPTSKYQQRYLVEVALAGQGSGGEVMAALGKDSGAYWLGSF